MYYNTLLNKGYKNKQEVKRDIKYIFLRPSSGSLMFTVFRKHKCLTSRSTVATSGPIKEVEH